jgi:hypothetical protein
MDVATVSILVLLQHISNLTSTMFARTSRLLSTRGLTAAKSRPRHLFWPTVHTLAPLPTPETDGVCLNGCGTMTTPTQLFVLFFLTPLAR